jgi:hypothetical protein
MQLINNKSAKSSPIKELEKAVRIMMEEFRLQ